MYAYLYPMIIIGGFHKNKWYYHNIMIVGCGMHHKQTRWSYTFGKTVTTNLKHIPSLYQPVVQMWTIQLWLPVMVHIFTHYDVTVLHILFNVVYFITMECIKLPSVYLETTKMRTRDIRQFTHFTEGSIAWNNSRANLSTYRV